MGLAQAGVPTSARTLRPLAACPTHLTVGLWEPGESRGSRRVLRAAGGAIPPADSPVQRQVGALVGGQSYPEGTLPASSATRHIRACSAADMWGSNTFHAT